MTWTRPKRTQATITTDRRRRRIVTEWFDGPEIHEIAHTLHNLDVRYKIEEE